MGSSALLSKVALLDAGASGLGRIINGKDWNPASPPPMKFTRSVLLNKRMTLIYRIIPPVGAPLWVTLRLRLLSGITSERRHSILMPERISVSGLIITDALSLAASNPGER